MSSIASGQFYIHAECFCSVVNDLSGQHSRHLVHFA